MEDLIKALTIFRKYNQNNKYPTACEHDTLYIQNVEPSEISTEDVQELTKLGFIIDVENCEIYSYRYGN